MSGSENQHQRGLDDARQGLNRPPHDPEGRQAYEAGRSVHLSGESGRQYADAIAAGAGSLGGNIELRDIGSAFGFWLIVYFAVPAIFIGALAQQIVNLIPGAGVVALLAAIAGAVGGFCLVAWAFVRHSAFRRYYAIAFAAIPVALCVWAWISGAGGNSPFWQWLLLICGLIVILGGASWLTYRHIRNLADA